MWLMEDRVTRDATEEEKLHADTFEFVLLC